MLPSKDKSKDAKLYVTVDHKDDKIIIGDCLYRYFASKDVTKQPIVNFYYDQNTGKTSLANCYTDLPQEGVYTYGRMQLTLGHALVCPSLELNKIKNCLFEKHKNFIGVAASGILIDKQGKVLLTKRCSNLRSFPSAWVFPGGKVDMKESIEDAVLREIQEETGINVIMNEYESTMEFEEEGSKKNQYHNVKCSMIDPFFIWESVYPSSLKVGLPQYQFIVIFFIIKLTKNSDEIKLKLQDQEVEKALWIPLDKLYEILTTTDPKDPVLNESLKAFYSPNDYSDFNLIFLKDIYPNQFGEGLGEGHKEAIKFYCEKIKRKY